MRCQGSVVVRLAAFRSRYLELCKNLRDWIEVGRVRRQEARAWRRRCEGCGRCLPLWLPRLSIITMSPAGCERRHKELFDIGLEAHAVDRAIEHAGGIDAVVAQRAKKASVRQRPCGTLATRRRPPAQRPCVRGIGPGLVEEDEARRGSSLL